MARYHCKCEATVINSDTRPPLCTSCHACHTALRVGKALPRRPLPHEFSVERVTSRCKHCHRERTEVPIDDRIIFKAGRWPEKAKP